MGSIEQAIAEFRAKRRDVYKADSDQIVRDTRAAERASKDHLGRWFFELLQNSDDAEAAEVKVRLTEKAVYIADNGKGLKPEAVKAISGTDFSDKSMGTIGRKGVGFKSVYEISNIPQVFTIYGEGIEFCPHKAGNWLIENGFKSQYVPHPWIPFFISRDEAEQQDSVLRELGNYNTIVKLHLSATHNGKEIEEQFSKLPPHILLAFRHVRMVDIEPTVLITVKQEEDGIWIIQDYRGNVPETWKVVKNCEKPPDHILRDLNHEERDRVHKDGIGFLSPSPLERNYVVPTNGYPLIHVFYPTEQKGPVRMLLHAEFLVKSDRTDLIPIEKSVFNQWVAERLAAYVSNFIQNAYHPNEPSSHIRLLLPFKDTETHRVASAIWKYIVEKVRSYLQIGNMAGEQRLNVNEAILISVSVDVGRARRLLEATESKKYLLHQTFDDDLEALRALKCLGCQEITDKDLIRVIADISPSKALDQKWIWTCWEWLAAWVAQTTYGDEKRKRIECVKSLPIVPVSGELLKPSGLKGYIVTWRAYEQANDLPDWLPLVFIDDWFRNRFLELPEGDSVAKNITNIFKALDIKESGRDVIHRAVGKAIEQFWADKKGDPERFLLYILQQNWHEVSHPTKAMQRCPIPGVCEGTDDIIWVEATAAYFGEKWDNSALALLYKGNSKIIWAQRLDLDVSIKIQCAVLGWLGVFDCPRVLEDGGEKFVCELDKDYQDWKTFLNTSHDSLGRSATKVDGISWLDHVTAKSLDEPKALALVRLIANNWDSYYREISEVKVYGAFSRERYYRSWKIQAKWMFETCQGLKLPTYKNGFVPLTDCWLPDKPTERTIGDLLPILDIDRFKEEGEIVNRWLIDVVKLRTRMEQLTIRDWDKILLKRIPHLAPDEVAALDDRIRDKVTKWYENCLEAANDNEDYPENCFRFCPLLCRKGKEWKYVKDEPRYLADDRELSEAFVDYAWLVELPSRLKSAAEKYFCIQALSKCTLALPQISDIRQRFSGELEVKLKQTLPYVFAWRLSQAKQNAEKLRNKLKSFTVWIVDKLGVILEFGDISKDVGRRFILAESDIFLQECDVGEAVLGEAMAEILEIRSEADFYENLLRCENDDQRKAKLLAKGLTDTDIDPQLRAYEESHSVREEQESSDRTEKEQQKAKSVLSEGEVTNTEIQPNRLAETGSDGIAQETNSSSFTTAQDKSSTVIFLKDANITEYVTVRPVSSDYSFTRTRDHYSDTQSQSSKSLSQEQKLDIEKCGRAFAKRELQNLGYQVEEMPQDQPGFDLRATKEAQELRLEVKAHLGKSTVVELTTRQYQEYLGRTQGGYDWQLWNIENLEQNELLSIITKYPSIPDEALDAKTFRVDLKKCPVSNQ